MILSTGSINQMVYSLQEQACITTDVTVVRAVMLPPWAAWLVVGWPY